MDLMARAAELKGELLEFGLSPRFDRAFRSLLAEAFPGGVVTDEGVFAAVADSFLLDHRFPSGETVVDKFVASRTDLSTEDREMLLAWKDGVQSVFRIRERDGEDAVVCDNLVDELTYRVRSNMGREGIDPLIIGGYMIGRIVPVGDDWMISGMPATYGADAADAIRDVAAEMAMRSPESVFRNPDKLARAWETQARQRESFIELFGGDLIVVPGHEANDRLREFYRFDHERQKAPDAPEWTGSGLDGLPEEVTECETVGLIYDAEDGLGVYYEFGDAEAAFADPHLIVRRRYREVVSAYLREDGISPVPLRRLAARDTAKATELFRKLLKKPGFDWGRDGEALLRRHKSAYFERPPLPRVTPVSEMQASHRRA